MFPMGIRIWDQNRMIYPVKFSVYLDLEKNISSIKTLIEGKKYQTFNYMMLTTGIAINGYIYEKDIVMIDGEEDKVGIVEFDKMAGAFVVKVKDETFVVNEAMEFCEVLGNVYEDAYLLDMYSLTFNNDIVYDNFNDTDKFEDDEHIIEQENIKEMSLEMVPETVAEEVVIEEPVKEDSLIEEEKAEETSEAIEEKISEETSDDNIEIVIEENIPQEEIKEEISLPVEIEESKEEQENIIEEEIPETVAEESIIITDEKGKMAELADTIDDIKIDDIKIVEITEIDEEVIDGNLFMGTEDLVFLDDSDLEEPIEEEIIPDDDLLDNINNEPLVEELPPDDVFGDGVVSETKQAPKEEKIEAEEVVIYAIGYCAVDNGPGTYSYIINADGKDVKEFSGGLESTILNRIQLIGVIEALKNIKECDNIKVYCDSKYVISPFIKGWIYKWQQNDWKKDSDNKVLNCDLWEEIFNLTKDFSVQWEFVKDVNDIAETKKCSENTKKEIEKFIK